MAARKWEALRNRAGESKSPYLGRHSHLPVAWQPLSQDSIDRASDEKKLIFLNIGSAPCHYAQLMTQDSWSRSSVAALLNQHYVPIMVDRDEHPDLDSIYAHYLMSIHGKAGYPMNLFLTPKLHPVYGDTYLEGPTEHDDDVIGEDNPNIIFLLKRVEKHWREGRERLLAEAKATFEQLREMLAEGTRSQPAENGTGSGCHGDADLEMEMMEEAYSGHAKLYDPLNAGFLSVPTDPANPAVIPKFSMVSRLDYLLRLSHLPPVVRGVVGDAECENATKMALATLRKMRDMAMHDHLGGGFHSSTQTRDWKFPLFDKVTGHNAQLLDLYLDAWLTTSSPENRSGVNMDELWRDDENEFLDVVVSLADYLTSPPLCRPDGSFCTSEAADSQPFRGPNQLRAGAYYVWSKKDFVAVVESGTNAEFAAGFWNVRREGNIDKLLDPRDEFIMENVLSAVGDEERLAARYGVRPAAARKELLKSKEALKKHRDTHRSRPATDNRVLAGKNGKVIAALSRTGGALRAISKRLGDKYVDAAARATAFIRDNMWDGTAKILYRIYDIDRQSLRGFCEDYAFLINGLLHLYEASGEVGWLSWAEELQEAQINMFYDTRLSRSTPTDVEAHCGGFYSSERDSPYTIIRVKNAMDDVSPSVNGISASNLFRLGALLADERYVRLARETIMAFDVEIPVHPGLFTSLLVNLVTAKIGGTKWLAVVSSSSSSGGEACSAGTPDQVEGERRVSAKDLRTKFHTIPRAGLKAMTVVKGDGAEGDTWLAKRNEAVRMLLDAGVEDDVGYVFDHDLASYRPCTVQEVEAFDRCEDIFVRVGT